MKIVCITDIHGNSDYITSVSEDLSSADMVLVAGDITHFGSALRAEEIINCLRRFNSDIFAVSGNCDRPDVDTFLTENGLSLNEKVIRAKGAQVFGISGSLPCPGTTVNEFCEQVFETKLRKIEQNIAEDLISIFVSHQPPYNTGCDVVPSGAHVGSKAVRHFIEFVTPAVCITGHIHEARGVDKIKTTEIINPGSFRDGHYAVVHISGDQIEVSARSVELN